MYTLAKVAIKSSPHSDWIELIQVFSTGIPHSLKFLRTKIFMVCLNSLGKLIFGIQILLIGYFPPIAMYKELEITI